MTILNNANICISNIFDIFKWIFKTKVVPVESRLNSQLQAESSQSISAFHPSAPPKAYIVHRSYRLRHV